MVGTIVAAALSAMLNSATAAELQLPRSVVHERQAAACDDPCGCLHARFEYHRELLSTYGTGFDPRNFDTTQPYFYFGRVRAYPQFWCGADVQ